MVTSAIRKIRLTRGLVALVDQEDYERLNPYKWHTVGSPKTGCYGGRCIKVDGVRVYLYLAREVMSVIDKKKVVFFKDDNSLNCRRSNLEVMTKAELRKRRQAKINREVKSSSGFRGVYWNDRFGHYTAQISVKGRRQHLGVFKNAIDAAIEWNTKAIEFRGKKAFQNSIP